MPGPKRSVKSVTRSSFSQVPITVLDTNVVLDWLVFRDPASAGLHRALEAGCLRWIATTAMREELQHVLSRGSLNAWHPDLASLWSAWNRHCEELAKPAPLAMALALRCSDSDDQKFIDLAVAAGARWLISRDRAVLKLAAPLHAASVEVLTPVDWIGRQEHDRCTGSTDFGSDL